MTCGLRSIRWAHVALWVIVAAVGIALFASLAHAAPAPAPTFSGGNVTAPESTPMGSSAVVAFVKSGPAKSYSKIRIRTADGTAKAGVDYTPIDVTLTFGNSELVKSVSVPIVNDSLAEPSESFTVNCIAVRFARCGAPAVATIVDDDAAPAPPPPTGLGGEPPIPDNFDSAAGLEAEQGPATISIDAVSAFRMFCTYAWLGKIDPLVLPGQVGVSHLHMGFGNTGVTENSNSQSLRTSGGTTCGTDQDHPLNRSAYWHPAMLDNAGHAVPPDFDNLYYKRNPSGDPMCSLSSAQHLGQCVDLPNGIRFVFGFDMRTAVDPEPDATRFGCWASEDGTIPGAGTGRYHSIAEVAAIGCPVGAQLVIATSAPNCWDGRVDSPDHRSHMAYASGPYYDPQMFRACPADHPYMIPDMQVQVHFTVRSATFLSTLRLSSDDMIAGAAPGSTWHMDYWEAWSPAIKALWHRNCIDKHLSCGNGALGEGRAIRGANAPNGEWPVPAPVPVP